MLKAIAVWIMLVGAAAAADYSAITKSDAVLRAAPNIEAVQTGVVPAQTSLEVTVCFYEGAYCHVTGPNVEGYVAGDLLTVRDTNETVLAAETRRLGAIADKVRYDAVPWATRRNIVAWGDSLSMQTYDNELKAIFPTRTIELNGKSGDTAKQAMERMLGTERRYFGWITIIWDRHYTNQQPEEYIRDFTALVAAVPSDRFIVIGDLIATNANEDPGTPTRQMVDTVNAQLKQLYPDNYLDPNPFLYDPKLRRLDGIHLSPEGNQLLAEQIAMFIRARGW